MLIVCGVGTESNWSDGCSMRMCTFAWVQRLRRYSLSPCSKPYIRQNGKL